VVLCSGDAYTPRYRLCSDPLGGPREGCHAGTSGAGKVSGITAHSGRVQRRRGYAGTGTAVGPTVVGATAHGRQLGRDAAASKPVGVGVQREVTDTEADEDFEGGEEAEDYNFDLDDDKEGGINFAPQDAGPMTKSEMKRAAKSSTPSRSDEEWEAFNERQAAWEAHMEKINPRTADENVVRQRSELQDRWGGGSGDMAVDMGLAAPPKSRFRRMLSGAKKGLQKGSKWALKKAGLGQEEPAAVAAPIPLTPEERQKRRAFKVSMRGDDEYW
jgi:hypothetical protein